MALWEPLNTAWGGTFWVGLFVDRSLVKATCGSGVEDCDDGSLVCFLYRQEQILPPHRAGKALCAGREACKLHRLCARACQETREVGLLPH